MLLSAKGTALCQDDSNNCPVVLHVQSNPSSHLDESSLGLALICTSCLHAGLCGSSSERAWSPQRQQGRVSSYGCLEVAFRLELIIAYIQVLYTS